MTSKILKGLALGMLLASCSADENVGLAKGVGDNAGNAVYMGNKNASGVISVLASDADGASFSVTPRLAVATDKDVQVTVEVDAATLAAYNKANNLNVTAISPDDVVFTAEDGSQSKGKVTATIKAGEVLAVVPGKLVSLNTEKYPYGGRYAIPVKITNVGSGMKLLSSPTSTIISLDRKIKTSVLHVKNNTGDHGYSMLFTPSTPYENEMSEWTLQYQAQFQNLRMGNMTTASLSSGPGFYNRISATGGLQVKSEGRDGTDTWTNKPVPEKQWLYVTYVYRKSGLVGHLTVYVNGEIQKTFVTSLLYLDKQGRWGFGNSNVTDYYLRELRFWNRALTPAEIQDKSYLPENAKSEGLEAYFPLTKESYDETTKTFKDLTGKWKWSLAPKIQDGTVKFNYEIVDNVIFPAKSLTIEP